MTEEGNNCRYLEYHHLNFFLYILYAHFITMVFYKMSANTYLPSLMYRVRVLLNAIYKYMNPQKTYLNASDSVLLVIDMVDAYRSLFSSRMIKEINGNIELAKKNNIPVVYTKWVRTNNTDDMIGDVVDGKRFWSFYIPEKTDIIDELKKNIAKDDLIINTIFPNTFAHGTQLMDVIKKRKNLILCGTWTESCIKHTADAAVEMNLRPYILKFACSGHWPFSSWSMIIQGMLQSEIVKSLIYV